MTKTDIIYKYENKIPFKESEMKEMIFEEIPGVDTVQAYNMLDKGRWSITMENVIKIDGRYFSITWEEAATEMQENYYYDDITEVIPMIVQKVEYVKKEKRVMEVPFDETV